MIHGDTDGPIKSRYFRCCSKGRLPKRLVSTVVGDVELWERALSSLSQTSHRGAGSADQEPEPVYRLKDLASAQRMRKTGFKSQHHRTPPHP